MTVTERPTDLTKAPAVPGSGAGKPAVPDATDPLGELAEVHRMSPGTDLTEIGRRAAHVAAFQHAVLPVAEAKLADGVTQGAELRRHARELTRTLYWLGRHLTGDVRAAAWPTSRITQEVQQAISGYVQAERALISALAEVLDPHGVTELAKAYHRAAREAPTRPHPRLSYRGRTGRLTFRLAAFIDDVRDGTDNRPVGREVSHRAVRALYDLESRAVAGTPALPVGSRSMPALAKS